MIWDIMYELPLFGKRAVVRAADALLTATHDRGTTQGNARGRAPTGS